MKGFIKLLVVGGFYITLCTSLFAQEQQTSIQIRRTWEPYQLFTEYTFENGETLSVNENTSYMFLMLDGTIISNAEVKLVDGYYMLSMDTVSKKMGIDSQEINEKFNKQLKKVNNVVYVPAQLIAQEYSYSIATDNVIMPNMLVMDKNKLTKVMSKEQAVETVKKVLNQKYSEWKQTESYKICMEQGSNESLADLENDIASISVERKVSRYWILSGPKKMILDEITGEIYYESGAYTSTWIKSIKDESAMHELFLSGYFAG